MSSFFTYQQRLLLQKYLTAGNSFKEITSLLEKDPTTISREVRNNLSLIASGKPGYPYNPCRNRVHCRRKNVCAEKDPCTRKSVSYCKLCSKCNDHCPDFVEEVCSSRFRAPYVCNGCNSIGQCTLRKNIYDAAHAEEKTHERLSQSRFRVFYCDAGSPYQKGSIEVNHELIRRVLEGKDVRNRSFNDLTQEDVTLKPSLLAH